MSYVTLVVIALGKFPPAAPLTRSVALERLGILPHVKFKFFLLGVLPLAMVGGESIFMERLMELQTHEQLWLTLSVLVPNAAALRVDQVVILSFVEQLSIEEGRVDLLGQFMEGGFRETTILALVVLLEHLSSFSRIEVLLMFTELLSLLAVIEELELFLQIGELGIGDAVELQLSYIFVVLII